LNNEERKNDMINNINVVLMMINEEMKILILILPVLHYDYMPVCILSMWKV